MCFHFCRENDSPIQPCLQLVGRLSKILESGEQELNMLDWMSRAALEYIGQGGLGYSFDALDRTKTNAYAESAKTLL